MVDRLYSDQGEYLPCSGSSLILQLRQRIVEGTHWYIALLEAIGQWTETEEYIDGHRYQYLVDDEAFDWLLLAERICADIADLVPDEERVNLLFCGTSPLKLTLDEFKDRIGESKYYAYLNYFYGVVVEGVLSIVVEEEIYKEQQSFITYGEGEAEDEIYKRIYGADPCTLLECFKVEKGYADVSEMSLFEMKELTYWLFRYRIRHSDKAKVASDTKKALAYLQRQRINNHHLDRSGGNGVKPILDTDLMYCREVNEVLGKR
ncbi:MAG: hypothetical protein SVY53_14425 [Chloroflexota bacterium]|nr:hypothetical protein [Chloroflexota bacterium]